MPEKTQLSLLFGACCYLAVESLPSREGKAETKIIPASIIKKAPLRAVSSIQFSLGFCFDLRQPELLSDLYYNIVYYVEFVKKKMT